MGGAVSSGRDNNELIDNLIGSNYIRTPLVERVFRAVDRAEYMLPESRSQAYKDLAWKSGPLHLSAPCIYSEVMEGLELRTGLTFLNVGSGTGYLSTMAGLILGSCGINHGIEMQAQVVEYAMQGLRDFLTHSPAVDEFEFCEPKFLQGNGLCLAPLLVQYDRVYCGAGCPPEYENYFKQLIKVGGVLVMPLSENLLQVRRVSETSWTSKLLLNVSFAPLMVPSKEESINFIKSLDMSPPSLQVMSRATIRTQLRSALFKANPDLEEQPIRPVASKKNCPRRICIPIEDDSDIDGFNALHDLDPASGANEMNALLSLVLSMGQNRVAGALRFDRITSSSSSYSSSSSSSSSNHNSDSEHAEGDNPVRKPVRERKDPFVESQEVNDGALDMVSEGIVNNYPSDHLPVAKAERKTNEKTSVKVKSSQRAQISDLTQEPCTSKVDSKEFNNSSSIVKASGSSIPGSADVMECDGARNEKDLINANPSYSNHRSDRKQGSREELETTDPKEQLGKRDKFDSGLGEENSPDDSTSPRKEDSKTDDSDMDNKSDSSSEVEHWERHYKRITNTARVIQKAVKRRRMYHSQGPDSSSSEESGRESPIVPTRQKQKKISAPDPCDVRRHNISNLLRQSIRDLPLPHPLKLYLNLHRTF